jgi:hypothetical protein
MGLPTMGRSIANFPAPNHLILRGWKPQPQRQAPNKQYSSGHGSRGMPVGATNPVLPERQPLAVSPRQFNQSPILGTFKGELNAEQGFERFAERLIALRCSGIHPVIEAVRKTKSRSVSKIGFRANPRRYIGTACQFRPIATAIRTTRYHRGGERTYASVRDKAEPHPKCVKPRGQIRPPNLEKQDK